MKRQHFVHYSYVPGFGFYGLGLIHIIGGYAKAGTSIIRQLVDAGTLSNLPGGLKSRGLRIKGDDEPIEPGEFKDVDVPSGSIRDNIMPLPYKEPSQTLLALRTTMAQRVVQYQTVLQMSQQAPQIYNLPQLHRQMIEVLGVKNAEKLVPTKDDVKLTDPISENINALAGTPIKAFISQDHEAHIAAHTQFLEDPKVAQGLAKNPQAKGIMQALQAHIAEHVAFRYRAEVEKKIGAALPYPNEELPPEMEVEMSRLAAAAGEQVTAQNKQQAAAMQAQQQAKDPIIQLKQQEVQIKQQEVQLKAQKDQLEAQIKQAEVQRKTQKDQMDAQIDQQQLELERQELEIDAQKAGAKLAADRRTANTKLDLDLMKAQSDAMNKQRKE
jgi:hypothetical protein